MKPQSQFSLFKQRRFLPYFLTQTLGAFNDNLYKNALLLFIAFGGISAAEHSALLTNLAAGLFILPFFIFSPIGGQLADKYEKSALIRHIKLAEIIIMAIAAIGIVRGDLWMMMVLLFLMGLQSTIFGPVKFALLPQQLHEQELVGGNALVETGTFLAILAGTISAGLFFDLTNARELIAAAVLVFAILGYFSSRAIPVAAPNDPYLKICWNPVTELWRTLQETRQNQSIFLSIMAISWFWFIGASYLTQFANFSHDYLGSSTQLVTLLLTLFSVGVAIGSLLCERLSGHRIELGIVPIGSLGLSIFGIDLYFAIDHIQAGTFVDAMSFLKNPAHWRMMIDIAMVSASGGLFVVPLQALIQQRSNNKNRAQIIAANNVMNALFMVVSAITGIVLLSVFKLSIAEYFLIIAIMNIVIAIYVYSTVTEFALRFMVWLLSHTLYRVTHKGLANIPDEGPGVLVCNHVSYVDALLIAGACHRPVRFVMDRAIAEMPGLKAFFKLAKTIPICSPKVDITVYENAFQRVKEELADGNIICIFPEGRLTKNGELGEFRPGIERILQESPVPVIPTALVGLWGSFFSHKDGHAFTTFPRRFWSKVSFVVGEPQPPNTSAAVLQQQVNTLLLQNAGPNAAQDSKMGTNDTTRVD